MEVINYALFDRLNMQETGYRTKNTERYAAMISGLFSGSKPVNRQITAKAIWTTKRLFTSLTKKDT